MSDTGGKNLDNIEPDQCVIESFFSKIEHRSAQNVHLLDFIHCFSRPTEAKRRPGFDLYEGNGLLFFGDDIDFTGGAAEVALKDGQPGALQRLAGSSFARGSRSTFIHDHHQ